MMKHSFIEAYKKHHDLDAEVQFFEERQKEKADQRAKDDDLRRSQQEVADQDDEDKEESPSTKIDLAESHFDEQKTIIIPKDE